MKTKPTILICMPCYDDVKINTMLSIFKMAKALSRSGIEVGINTMKSPLIHQARNYLTATFLKSKYSHLLFIDSDVEFEPEAVVKMMVADKDIICTPYRTKSLNPALHNYTVEFKNPDDIPILPGGLVEIEAGPTGIMLINRKVFEKLMDKHPELKIKNRAAGPGKSQGDELKDEHQFYYNFFDFKFENGYSMGEDVAFCRLARKNNIKIYANIDSQTAHHGGFVWRGAFKDRLIDEEKGKK